MGEVDRGIVGECDCLHAARPLGAQIFVGVQVVEVLVDEYGAVVAELYAQEVDVHVGIALGIEGVPTGRVGKPQVVQSESVSSATVGGTGTGYIGDAVALGKTAQASGERKGQDADRLKKALGSVAERRVTYPELTEK